MAAATAPGATVEVALDCSCSLGESPVWDGKTNTLYFVVRNRQGLHGVLRGARLGSTWGGLEFAVVVELLEAGRMPLGLNQPRRSLAGHWEWHGTPRPCRVHTHAFSAQCTGPLDPQRGAHVLRGARFLHGRGPCPTPPSKRTTPFPRAQDINSNRIYGYVPADGSSFVIQLDEPAATIVPTSDPEKILVATRWDVLEVDVPSRKLTGRVLATSPEADGRGE